MKRSEPSTTDPTRFRELYQQHYAVAYQHALRVVRNSFDAEDVTQTAMARAFERKDQLRDSDRFGGWLISIVRNTAIDFVRDRQRRNETGDDVADVLERLGNSSKVSQVSTDIRATDTGSSTSVDILHNAVLQLSPALRSVVQLRVESNLSLEQIAERLEIPLGTVKRRLFDARRKLRRIMMKQYDVEAAKTILDKAARDIDALPARTRQDIIGVALGGDIPRGEFIPNNSNLLVVPLYSNQNSLSISDLPGYHAINEIFDRHCAPYHDCAESPRVWDHLWTDELHAPFSASSFDPPRLPQPAWLSMYLFDLIDHHTILYGDEFVSRLHTPDPKTLVPRAMSESLRVSRGFAGLRPKPPVGEGTLLVWQVVKVVQLLQIYWSPDRPSIAKADVLTRYREHVPEFETKPFGEKCFKGWIDARYPADRKEYGEHVAETARAFIEESCRLIVGASRGG